MLVLLVPKPRVKMASPGRLESQACRLGGGCSIISSVRFQFFSAIYLHIKLAALGQFIAGVLEYLNGSFGLRSQLAPAIGQEYRFVRYVLRPF